MSNLKRNSSSPLSQLQDPIWGKMGGCQHPSFSVRGLFDTAGHMLIQPLPSFHLTLANFSSFSISLSSSSKLPLFIIQSFFSPPTLLCLRTTHQHSLFLHFFCAYYYPFPSLILFSLFLMRKLHNNFRFLVCLLLLPAASSVSQFPLNPFCCIVPF